MDRRFLAGVLLRCFIYGFILVLWWAAMVLVAGDLIFDVQRRVFDLTRHEFNLINYCGIGLLKILVFLGFFIPWLAVRFCGKGPDQPRGKGWWL
jgi:hypothetical protein